MDEQYETAPAVDEIIKLAFVLPGESGVDLLLRLGTYDVWRGDLAAMRDDVPRAAATESVSPPTADNVAGAERLYDALRMKKALAYLQPRCLETLRLRYLEGRDVDEKLVANCRRRSYEIMNNIDGGGLHAEPRKNELSPQRLDRCASRARA
jgi:hypothetical protein